MRINIASPGRFHVMDLARELIKYGHQVQFYSYVPTNRAVKFGLPRECNHSFLWIMAPFLLIYKYFPSLKRWLLPISSKIQDYMTGWFMKPCDVCIVMSESFVYAAKIAKKNNAVVFIERGSKHGVDRRRIMDEIEVLKGNKPYHQKAYEKENREEEGYLYADYIAIPADHVLRSFQEVGFPVEKLFTNQYGVDVSIFSPSVLDKEDSYDVLMVGGWSYRKGCDILWKACSDLGLTLLHVGGIVDCPLPESPFFTHVDSVDQMQLPKYYAKGKIFCLPSREEGLALVQVQALASGLPIVCSQDSGGREFWQYIPDKRWVIEMSAFSVENLKTCIKQALDLAAMQPIGEPRNYCGNALNHLTWEAYGKRYNAKIEEAIKIRNKNAK